MKAPALVVLNRGGRALADRLVPKLPGAEIYGLKNRVTTDIAFTNTLAHLRQLFAEDRPIIAVMAAGIVIRALAPLLTDKRREPPVLTVSEDGASVVPLLGGHHGANELAMRIAKIAGGTAAVTTASDTALGVALDEPPPGYRLANPESAKAVTAALLAGETARIVIETGDGTWLKKGHFKTARQGTVTLRVSDAAAKPARRELLYRPATLALGVGSERGVEPKELIALARHTLKAKRLAAESVACVVSLDVKSDEAAVHALANDLGVPARFFPAARLERETPRLKHPSEAVFKAVGCHGVAEGAALAAAGRKAALIVPKTASKRATVAIARSPKPIDGEKTGQPQGRLDIVGLGREIALG